MKRLMNMKRLMLVWVMFLCTVLFLCVVAAAEGLPTMPPTPVPMVLEDEPGDWEDWDEPGWAELEHYRSGDFTVVVNGEALEIAEYLGTDTAAVVPAEIDGLPVTYIWPDTFGLDQEIVSVEIQAQITELDGTFSCCGKLETIILPDSIRVIGLEAFMGCHSLREIAIPEGVTTIRPEAFANCDALEIIRLPESVTVIDEFAFSTCTSLTSINIPTGVTTIGNYAFELCGSLTAISIPAGVTSIGRRAFDRSDSLVITVIPGSCAETYCRDNWLTYVTTDE